MAEVQLEDVLKLLVRQPLSQTALAQRLNLSKSHVSFLVKNLLDQGYLERDKRRGRGRRYAPQAAS
ncbi:MAG TPA: winged helix-turn-helix transcriptional regulator [Candidatus Avisuccinivibrio pullicola]|nr:winged helix-turn-helix transcriptional regulator [Candidatus Avisuccinivibrio pullicola]